MQDRFLRVEVVPLTLFFCMQALGALISAGASYESVVQEAVDYFDNRKAMHGAGRLNSQQGGGGGGQGGGQGYGDDGYDDSQSMMGGGGGRRGYGADSYA